MRSFVEGILGLNNECARRSYYWQTLERSTDSPLWLSRRSALHKSAISQFQKSSGRFVSNTLHRNMVYSRERDIPGYFCLEIVSAVRFDRIQSEHLSDRVLTLIHYGMAFHYFDWGCYAFYWPDGNEIRFFDYEKDSAYQKFILDSVEKFQDDHVMVKQIPDRNRNANCHTCEFQSTCHERNERPVSDDFDYYADVKKKILASRSLYELDYAWSYFTHVSEHKGYGLGTMEAERAKNTLEEFRKLKDFKSTRLRNADL